MQEIVSESELKTLLDQMAEKIIRERNTAKDCCQMKIKAGYEISSIEDLEDIMKNCKVVFINFYSPVCPHCIMFDEVFLSIGEKYKEKAAFVKSNVFYSSNIAYMFNVLGTPTTIALIHSSVYDRIVGYVPPTVFEAFVRRTLSKANCLN